MSDWILLIWIFVCGLISGYNICDAARHKRSTMFYQDLINFMDTMHALPSHEETMMLYRHAQDMRFKQIVKTKV